MEVLYFHHLDCFHAARKECNTTIIVLNYFFRLQTFIFVRIMAKVSCVFFCHLKSNGSNILHQLVSLHAENIMVVFWF